MIEDLFFVSCIVVMLHTDNALTPGFNYSVVLCFSSLGSLPLPIFDDSNNTELYHPAVAKAVAWAARNIEAPEMR